MTTRAFWRRTIERVIRSFAQGLIVGLGLSPIGDAVNNAQLDAFDADWGAAIGVGLGMAILSLAMCIIATPFGPEESPSVVA